MTTYELLKQIHLLLGGTVEGQYVWELISKLSSSEREYYRRSFNEPSLVRRLFFPPSSKSRTRELSPTGRLIKEINPKDFFFSMNALEMELKNIDLELGESATDQIPDLLRAFAKTYEAYLKRDQYIDDEPSEESFARQMLVLVVQIKIGQEKLRDFYELIEKNILEPSEIHHGRDETLSLLFKTRVDLPLFLAKLMALNAIYAELCELFKISPKEIPLEIDRVESGSLWAKLFGESRVINLMTSLVESTVLYMHRNFTREGKLTALPKRLDIISSELDLERKLQESGIDTTALKENIQKSSILISKQLNSLLLGEAVVEINGKRHSVGSTLEETYLEQSKQLLIEDKMPETYTDQPNVE